MRPMRLFTLIAAICLIAVLAGDCHAFGGRFAARRAARQGGSCGSTANTSYRGTVGSCGQAPVGYHLQCGPGGCQAVQPSYMPIPAVK